MPRKKRPADWRKKIEEAYEEGGRGIGRMLAYYPEREKDVWAWIGGLKIYPRYYLLHFVRLWRKENPREWDSYRRTQYNRRKARERDQAIVQDDREQVMRDMGFDWGDK